jgi:ribosomal protein S18 acetylase RimI-like enzyme
MHISTRRATAHDVASVAPLFERYCVFYERHPAPGKAREFIEDRMRAGDSVILVAEVQTGDDDPVAAGFVQLYPKWSSTTMHLDWILNDLFVEPAYRRQGIARSLMQAAAKFARAQGAHTVSLKTQVTNIPAKALYESLGWVHDQEFDTYDLNL